MFTGNASPTWRSIEYGLELLKKGIIRRVGNGSSIRIWRDQWIPRETSLAVLGKKCHNRLRWASELIDQHTITWNMETLNELFHPPDVEEIQKLKLPLRGQMNFVAWHYEKSGIFSVKSAYRLGYRLQHEETQASSTSPDGSRSLWNNIWEANVPPKVKVFGWKTTNACLPTTRNKMEKKFRSNANLPYLWKR